MDHLTGWFDFSRRRDRKGYIIAIICIFLLALGMMLGLSLLTLSKQSRSLMIGAIGMLATAGQYALAGQRLRDFNQSGWWALIWLALPIIEDTIRPFFVIVLLILFGSIPGTKGENRFGSPPE